MVQAETKGSFKKTRSKYFPGFYNPCLSMIEALQPDIVVIEKVQKDAMIIHVAILWDLRVKSKENEKN